MLKVILCSGLNPQLAVADDFNKYKVCTYNFLDIILTYVRSIIDFLYDNHYIKCNFQTDVDQMFHTRGKGFTVLHPMSVFANQPDALALTESDIISVPHMSTKLTISAKHQLLCYL